MYKVFRLEDKSLWRESFSSLPLNQRDIYYTPEYYSLYEKNGDGRACCFVYEEDGECVLYPFLINSVNELGYELDGEYFDIQGAYGYNGIVSSSCEAGFINRFHQCFDSFCTEKRIIAEFTRFHPLLSNQRFASSKMQTLYSRNTVILDLSLSLEDIWMHQFSTKNRNLIRRTEKDGVKVVESKDYECFRRMYNQTMKALDAEDFYFFPDEYYREIESVFEDDMMLCFAMYENRAVCGSLFMFCSDYAHYHLSGRDRAYSRVAGNNAVLWYAIRKAKERGCRWFHLGGGTTGDDSDMLLHFKKNFSKQTGQFWIGKRIHNQPVYDSVVDQWKKIHPESYEMNRVKLLGYREI